MKRWMVILLFCVASVGFAGVTQKSTPTLEQTCPIKPYCQYYNSHDHFFLTPDGIKFSNKDGFYQASFNTLVNLDTSYFSPNNQHVNGDTNFSRFKTTQNFYFGKHWGAIVEERWFNRNKLNQINMSYHNTHFQAVAGQFFTDVGLNNTSNIADLDFLEFNLPDAALVPFSGVGAGALVNSDHFVFDVNAFGPQIGAKYKGHPWFTTTTRLIYAPIHDARHVLHFGFSGWMIRPSGGRTFEFDTIPEAEVASQATFVDTGTIINTNRGDLSGNAEFAVEDGPVSFLSEYILTNLNRQGPKPDLWFSGYYGQASYFLTGESREYVYPNGYFIGPEKINHQYGAFELAARVSEVDLNSHDIRGGEELNGTLGVNWYITKRIAVRFNYIRVWNHAPVTNKRDNFNIFIVRLQLQV